MKARHLLQLVLLSALWGASFLFIRVASPVLGPHVMAALRIGLATLTLVGIMRATREPWPWRHWRELTGLGALTVALPFLLYAWAALRLPARLSVLHRSERRPRGAGQAAGTRAPRRNAAETTPRWRRPTAVLCPTRRSPCWSFPRTSIISPWSVVPRRHATMVAAIFAMGR